VRVPTPKVPENRRDGETLAVGGAQFLVSAAWRGASYGHSWKSILNGGAGQTRPRHPAPGQNRFPFRLCTRTGLVSPNLAQVLLRLRATPSAPQFSSRSAASRWMIFCCSFARGRDPFSGIEIARSLRGAEGRGATVGRLGRGHPSMPRNAIHKQRFGPRVSGSPGAKWKILIIRAPEQSVTYGPWEPRDPIEPGRFCFRRWKNPGMPKPAERPFEEGRRNDLSAL